MGLTIAVLTYGYVSNDLLGRPVPPKYEIALVYVVFVSSAVLFRLRTAAGVLAVAGAALLPIAYMSDAPVYFVAAYLLVTIVHVLVFTAAFVLYGALRTKSRSGLVSLAVFVACVASCFVLRLGPALGAPVSLRAIYAFFDPLNLQLAQLLGLGEGDVYESEGGLAVMRLIAFAYTYHYLNWFSKTSIIRWHDVPRLRAVAIVVLWIAAVGLYRLDYSAGLSVLYVLSLLHVLLELPLDHQTFAGIAAELRRTVAARAT